MNNNLQKPVLWLVICIFLVTVGAGYWIGTTMVVQPAGRESVFINSGENKSNTTYLLLETDDLSNDEPQLLSIWFIHINTEGKPKLGFTPVVSIDMAEDDNYSLLDKFSLNAELQPNRDFLSAVAKKGFSSQNYILVDQNSSAAFINWFAGKELQTPLALDKHSMAEYGPILRGFCSSISSASERSLVDFPWSKIVPGHFSTSLQFNKVLSNLAFLTSPSTPHCEMVPLP
jgi:hypothetical protein